MTIRDRLLLSLYGAGYVATMGYLVAADWPDMRWWNWPAMLGPDFFLAAIWPIYWAVLHWLPHIL